MNEEFKFDDTMPELTLEPVLEEAPQQPAPQPPKPEEPVLSPQEEQMVAQFAEKIDVENTAQILQYGAGTQKKMADFSDAALANVRTQDLGEVGTLITDVVTELKGFDAEEAKGFLGFFKKQANKLETMKAKYAKAEVNVEKISDALQAQLRETIAPEANYIDLLPLMREQLDRGETFSFKPGGVSMLPTIRPSFSSTKASSRMKSG